MKRGKQKQWRPRETKANIGRPQKVGWMIYIGKRPEKEDTSEIGVGRNCWMRPTSWNGWQRAEEKAEKEDLYVG